MNYRIESREDWPLRAADEVERLLARRPDAVIGFPTGHTPLPWYAELRRRSASGRLGAERMRAVMLDEYYGAGSSATSFYQWLRRELFDPLAITPERLLRMPAGESPEAAPEPIRAACAEFERRLAAWGGCESLFLGLGGNGHIGFNDPGSAADSRTRIVELAPETASANAEYWPGDFRPRYAVTQGIATILEARRIVLLVSGSAKAEVLRAALAGPITPDVPASFLQRSRALLVLADPDAAAGLIESGIRLESGNGERPS